MAMEGYLEFTVNGFLNVYTADTSMNGEILGINIAFICLFQTIIFLPLALLWAIFTKDEKKLSTLEFKESW